LFLYFSHLFLSSFPLCFFPSVFLSYSSNFILFLSLSRLSFFLYFSLSSLLRVFYSPSVSLRLFIFLCLPFP
jgi:hypothetical protein